MHSQHIIREGVPHPLPLSIGSCRPAAGTPRVGPTLCAVNDAPSTLIVHSPLETFTSWFSSKKESPPSESNDTSSIHHLVSSAFHDITSSPTAVAGISAVSATGLTLLSVIVYRRYIRRIRNADYVTSGMVQERKWIKGIVTR